MSANIMHRGLQQCKANACSAPTTAAAAAAAARYHRWLGHAVMIIVTAHSLGFWGVWVWQQQWLQEALDQGDRVNNLAGGVSFVSGLALWLSSLEVARRSNYEVFYKLHHIGEQ